jgi:putative membrane protein
MVFGSGNALPPDINNQTENQIMMKLFAIIATSAALAAFGTVNAQTTAAGALNDAQIAMIAVVADTVDVDAGKLAAEKASSKEVKAFAETMVRDHTAVNAKATALAKKLGDKMLTKLKGLSGAEFDKAYVDNEVAYHEAVIGVVTKTLIPNTKNAELKSLLESAGPIFTAHLEHAKHLQQSLTK